MFKCSKKTPRAFKPFKSFNRCAPFKSFQNKVRSKVQGFKSSRKTPESTIAWERNAEMAKT